MKTGKVSIK